MKSPSLSGGFSPVRKLTLLYVSALGTIALISIAGQVLIQSMLARQTHDAYVVNIAGRQRMLSQKLSKSALALVFTGDPLGRDARRRELSEVVQLWERSHLGLQLGDEALRLPGENSMRIRQMFAGLEPIHRQMLAAAKLIAHSNSADEIAREARVLLQNESEFLPLMDQIVFAYSAESGERVRRVATIEAALLVATLLVLVVEGLFVFRPAALRLRRTVEELWDTEDDLRREKAAVERLLAQARRGMTPAPARVVPLEIVKG
jgi:nitrate/nitrite-specific signal transduction histidine kinase